MAGAFRCELVSWARVVRLARNLALSIRAAGFQPDLIVAIARGGYVPARLIADCLGVMEVASFRIEHYAPGAHRKPVARVKHRLSVPVSGRRVLIVDDVGDTGDTFVAAMRHLRRIGQPAEVRTAVLHYKAGCRFMPDFSARIVKEWRWITYPWAVVEDLGEFIARLRPRPRSAAAISSALRRRYGLRVSRRTVEDVLAFTVRQKRASR